MSTKEMQRSNDVRYLVYICSLFTALFMIITLIVRNNPEKEALYYFMFVLSILGLVIILALIVKIIYDDNYPKEETANLL